MAYERGGVAYGKGAWPTGKGRGLRERAVAYGKGAWPTGKGRGLRERAVAYGKGAWPAGKGAWPNVSPPPFRYA